MAHIISILTGIKTEKRMKSSRGDKRLQLFSFSQIRCKKKARQKAGAIYDPYGNRGDNRIKRNQSGGGFNLGRRAAD